MGTIRVWLPLLGEHDVSMGWIYLRNTLLDDRRAYRRETQKLLARRDLDPELRARLELFRDDDPLELAEDRIQDAWLLDFARAFNAAVSAFVDELQPART